MDIEETIEMKIMKEVGVGLQKEFSDSNRRNDKSISISFRSGSRASTNRDRIRCYKCR